MELVQYNTAGGVDVHGNKPQKMSVVESLSRPALIQTGWRTDLANHDNDGIVNRPSDEFGTRRRAELPKLEVLRAD